MKTVYELKDKLKTDNEYVKTVQKLTLDDSRPLLGLKGAHGLFGSDEWWENIKNGVIKSESISGVIEECFFAGQDARWGDEVNSFILRLDNGSKLEESIYTKDKNNKKLFVPGAVVAIVYVFDELKKQPAQDGDINYSRTVLEVAVSEGEA